MVIAGEELELPAIDGKGVTFRESPYGVEEYCLAFRKRQFLAGEALKFLLGEEIHHRVTVYRMAVVGNILGAQGSPRSENSHVPALPFHHVLDGQSQGAGLLRHNIADHVFGVLIGPLGGD